MGNTSRQRVYAHVKQDRFILDNSESATNWSGSTDVSDLATAVNHREGTNSLSFAKSGVTEAFGQITRTLASAETINLVEYLDGVLGYWLNLSDLTNIANVQLIIGESASHNYIYQTADSALTTGWNKIEVDINTPTTTTGNGAAWSSINYIAVKVNFDNAANTLTAILVDTVYVKYSITSKTEITGIASGAGLATSAKQDTGNASLSSIDGKMTDLKTYTDGLEGFTDGLETLIGTTNTTLTTLNAYVDQLEGYTDGLEGALVTTNTNTGNSATSLSSIDTKLTSQATAANQTTMIGHLDGVEGTLSTIDTDTGSIDSKLGTLGQKNMAGSAPVVLASDQAAIPVTANAGTNLNTSLLALETGGNLATIAGKDFATQTTLSTIDTDTGNIATSTSSIDGKLGTLGQKAMVGSAPVVLASDQAAIPVIANAGTNLNTSLLALETGGNLATIAGDTTSIDGKITACNTGDIRQSTHDNFNCNANLQVENADITGLNPMPVSVGELAWDDSAALEASSVSKASAGTLYTVFGVNNNAATRYFQVYNSTTVPADASVPVISIPVPAGQSFSLDLGEFGKLCNTGISWANSTTLATKTVGGADFWVNLGYK